MNEHVPDLAALVERLAAAPDDRAAIREVAAWLRQRISLISNGSQPAPAGSLVERVAAVFLITTFTADDPVGARAVIRAVAAAAKERFNDPHFPVRWSDVVLWLEQEADRG